jgi:D-threo-aldose 1-dehydrogenase
MFDRVTTACALAATAAVVVWYWRRASRHWRERDIAFRQGTHQQQRRLGQSSVYVTVLGQGGAPLGDMYVKLDDATATGALSVAHEAGITLFDTAPWYGVGLSEARFGVALHRVPRDSFSLQTKVGRFLVPDPAGMNGKAVGWIGGFHNRIAFDYTAAGFERQLEDSLQRTGLGRIDSVVIHDLEPTPHRNPATGDTGLATAHAHLAQLRKSGFAACDLCSARMQATRCKHHGASTASATTCRSCWSSKAIRLEYTNDAKYALDTCCCGMHISTRPAAGPAGAGRRADASGAFTQA